MLFEKKRLRAINEKGDTGTGVLFNAYSFAEFLTRLNDLKSIADNDLKLLEESFAERKLIQEKEMNWKKKRRTVKPQGGEDGAGKN